MDAQRNFVGSVMNAGDGGSLSQAQQEMLTFMQNAGPADFDQMQTTIETAASQVTDGEPVSAEEVMGSDVWAEMTPEQQDAVNQAMAGLVVDSDDPDQEITITTPEELEAQGLTDEQVESAGTAMLLSLSQQAVDQDDVVRQAAEKVNEDNIMTQNYANAEEAANVAANSDGTSSPDDIMFEYTDPKTGETSQMSLADFCKQTGTALPTPDADGNYDSSDWSVVAGNLDSSAKALDSQSTTDATELQQEMDKYQQITDAMTNFEAAWQTMMTGIVKNIL